MADLCAAIRDAISGAGLTQSEVAKRIGVSQQAMSNYVTTREPSLDVLSLIEAELDLPRGFLLIRAGYVDVATDIEAAIAADERLADSDRVYLLNAYQYAVSRAPRGRGRGRRN